MSESAPSAPRDWVADRPFPWPATRSLPDGAEVCACFCLVDFQLARTRNDQPYLRLTLSDRHGPVEARVWQDAEAVADRLRAGAYFGVRGRVEFFNAQAQINVEALDPIRVDLDDLALFLPRSDRPQPEMERELEAFIASVTDGPLRQLLHLCLGAESDIGRGFRLAPAAKYNHHAYLGGLLEHTLSVAKVCRALAEHYAPDIDRDLLLAAALLHDVGKVREIGASAGFPYTDEGKLLGHILLGLQMVSAVAENVPALDPARFLLLQHLIAAHQGRYEWQSPREPALLEGIVLHYADDLDAKLGQVRVLLAQGEGAWTAYDRSFRREFLRHLRTPPGPSAATEVGASDSPPEPRPRQPISAANPGETPSPAHTAGESPAPPAGGQSRHRSARPHGASSFQRLSEDTLDLFGE